MLIVREMWHDWQHGTHLHISSHGVSPVLKTNHTQQLVDNTVCPYLSNHSTDHYNIFSSCYVCQMKAKLKISVHLQMGNYVNQVHHTINTGGSREVKIKNNFA